MTQQERTDILEWMKKAQWAHPDGSMYVTTHDLTAFIESLSMEDSETLRDGDWCEIYTTDEAERLWLTQHPGISGSKTLFLNSMNSGTMGYMGADLKYSIAYQGRKRQLPFDLFYQYARNTFKTPKP